MLTTRDIASLIWIAIGLILIVVVVLQQASSRDAWDRLWRAATEWKVLVIFGSLFAWVAVCVTIGHALSLPGLGRLWNWDLLKDTAWIVIFLAIPMVFRIVAADSTANIARPLIHESLGISAILVFYINLEPYPLWIELILQPAVTILAVCSYALKSRIKRRIIALILTVLLVVTAIWVLVQLIHDAPSLDWLAVLKDFLITVWLPLLLFPFLWIAAFLMGFESAVTRLRRNNHPASAAVALAVFLGLHFRIGLASRLNFTEQSIVNAVSFQAARAGMREFRARDRRTQKTIRDRRRDLVIYADVKGTDATGAQLDRREFEPTKRALDWISVVEVGHFTREGAYSNLDPDDLLQLNNFGLEGPYRLKLQVSADGSRWRAWRPTLTGWILGHGGRDSSSEWYFAGPTAPSTWPGDGDEWVNRPGDADLIPGPPDWTKRDGTEDLG